MAEYFGVHLSETIVQFHWYGALSDRGWCLESGYYTYAGGFST